MSEQRPAGGTAPPRRLTPWFGITGLLLLATLLAAGFVQVRQHALLGLMAQSQDDYLVLSLYQLEADYLRLRERWPAPEADQPAATPGLKMRYDIFVSRVALLRTERARRLTGTIERAPAVLASLDDFLGKADIYLGEAPWVSMDTQTAQLLRGELFALDAPIHDLLLDASHLVATQVTDRQAAIRQHSEIGMALTAFLSAMVLGFAVIALRQMRKLEQRRRHLEELADELRDARTEAEASAAAKARVLADMSHELRTPLHGLLGMLALLRETPRDPRAPQWLDMADEAASHLQRLLDDILDLSKLEAGTVVLQPQAVALVRLVDDVRNLMQPQAQAKGLGFEVALAPDLPAEAQLDPTRVKQVLFNLLNNAVRYCDSGSITLRCRRAATPGGKPGLEFDVIDTGPGMDAATIDRLFHRYSRAEESAGRAPGGAGLGLAISRNLARLMGGEIRVRSSPGAGSVFTFNFALGSAPSSAATAEDAPAVAEGSLRVLVAEDHPVNRMYLSALLERLGHRGVCVANGQEAVQAVQAQAFDVVLMDVHMPVMDGVTAAEHIRLLPAPAGRVRIVALTADVFAEARERCLAAGMDEVMTKPVNLNALVATLGRAASPPAGNSRTTAPSAGPGREPLLVDQAVLDSVAELMGARRSPALFGGFFEQADDAARRMRDAMREADPEALRRAAHAVKGAALNLGLPALADAAARLQRDADALAPTQLALAVQRYEELVQATRGLCEAQGLLRS